MAFGKDGRPLRFTLLSADDALRRAVSEVLQAQLRLAGADVEIRVLEFQTMLQQHRDRDYDAIFTNWVLDNFQVAAAPFALLHSSQAEVAQSANRSGVRSPRLDSLIVRGARATDLAAQRAAWGEFTAELTATQPLTFMFWLYELAASSDEIDGVEMDSRGELRTIARWTAAR
jgi:ABC-type transport system substrate-binding protein